MEVTISIYVLHFIMLVACNNVKLLEPRNHLSVSRVINGNIMDININCHGNEISIKNVKYLTMIDNTYTKFLRKQIKTKELLKELQLKLNFLESVKVPLHVESLKLPLHVKSLNNDTGELTMQYQCINATQPCRQKCLIEGATCISSLNQGECKCLHVPNDDWTDIYCLGASYKGCYNVNGSNADIVINISNLLKPSICLQACRILGYPYAGLAGIHNGCMCYEKFNFTQSSNEKKCISACLYDPIFSCGNYPFSHLYETGLSKTNSCCSYANHCPNGTYCIDTFDSHVCICNDTSENKPIECYGCLKGWISTPTSPNCYYVTDITRLQNQTSDFCSNLHGEEVVISNVKDLTFLLRVVFEGVIRNNTYTKVEAHFLENEDTHQFGRKQLPLCQRPKGEAVGKYPWSTWPKGTYGLPMTSSGCPKTSPYFTWQTGFYEQDTENNETQNFATAHIHLKGKFTNESIQQHFCIKKESVGATSWPKGRYCIYQKGDCPQHLKDGEIFWDDEDIGNKNTGKGELPDGMFKADTLIKFCCSTNQIVKSGIILPRDSPFYLFPYGSKQCQPVVGTTHTLEFIQWDLENDYDDITSIVAFKKNIPYSEIQVGTNHLLLYYCYYQPVQSCGAPISSSHIEYSESSFPVGYVLNYTCDHGYQNMGDKQDVCLNSQFWSSINGPRCVDIDECSMSQDSCHVKANCYNTEGSYYCRCNPGWTGDGKICKVVKCSDPPMLKNGYYFTLNFHPRTMFLEGSKIISRCGTNFSLIGYNISKCLPDGSWSTLPTCIPKPRCIKDTYSCMALNPKKKISNYLCSCKDMQSIECEEPPLVEHGYYINSSSRFYQGSQINWKCDQNFVLIGYNISTCLASALWTAYPLCEVNFTSKTLSPIIQSRTHLASVKVIITVVVSLVSVLVIITMILVALSRFRRKEKQKKKKAKKLKNHSSIYADINEFKLDIEFNKRKESRFSQVTNLSEVKYTHSPPHLPPRTSITSQESISPDNKSNVFMKPNNLQFRRRSDFGSSDLCLIPPQQFHTIFEQDPLRKRQSDAGERTSTQFKLNSMTQRRDSDFKFCSSLQTANIKKSTSMVSNMTDSTYSITEPTNEHTGGEPSSKADNSHVIPDIEDYLMENPYIDVNCVSYTDSELGSSSTSAHYDCLTNNNISINLRERSNTDCPIKTGLNVARQKYQNTLFRNLTRSTSLPDEISGNQNSNTNFNVENEKFLKTRRSYSDVGTNIDDNVFIADNVKLPPKKKQRKIRHRSGLSKLSFRFKLTSIKKPSKSTVRGETENHASNSDNDVNNSNNDVNNSDNDDCTSFPDLAFLRLKKYLSRKKSVDDNVKKRRSGTVSF